MYLRAQLNIQRIELIALSHIFAAMKLNYILIILIGIITTQSCKNDVDIYAPWKETPIVYGFIDINSDTQFVRISKTFQTSNNQTPQQGAQISDSLYFKNVEVTITNSRSGKKFNLTKSNTTPKNQGYFPNDVNYLYNDLGMLKIIDGLPNLPTDTLNYKGDNYVLNIHSLNTNNNYSANTSILGKAAIMPNSPNYQLYIRPELSYVYVLFNWEFVSNAVLYDGIIRYIYSENGVTKYADQIVAKNETTKNSNIIKSDQLNSFMKNYFNTDAMPVYQREIIKVQYVVLSGSIELKTAIDIESPNLSLLQFKPTYSNINGGLGLFTSRSTSIKDIGFQDDLSKYNLTKGVNGFPQ